MFGDEKQTKKSPIKNYFEWKSDTEAHTGKFKGRNKELQSELLITPEQFILLSQTSCIKGWDKASNSGIYSNEVEYIKDEELTVRAFKSDKVLFQGIYDRAAIEAIGGDFHKGLIVLEGDVLNEYYLKGGAFKQFGEDVDGIDTNKYKIKFNKAEERKNGAVTYYVPRFVQGDEITADERTKALECVSLLRENK